MDYAGKLHRIINCNNKRYIYHEHITPKILQSAEEVVENEGVLRR